MTIKDGAAPAMAGSASEKTCARGGARYKPDRPTWTSEREHLLRTRWAAGATANDIAAELGVGRGAVLAKTRRLGLDRRHEAQETRVDKFERVLTLITEADIPLTEAARRCDMAPRVAEREFAALCSRMGRQAA